MMPAGPSAALVRGITFSGIGWSQPRVLPQQEELERAGRRLPEAADAIGGDWRHTRQAQGARSTDASASTSSAWAVPAGDARGARASPPCACCGAGHDPRARTGAQHAPGSVRRPAAAARSRRAGARGVPGYRSCGARKVRCRVREHTGWPTTPAFFGKRVHREGEPWGVSRRRGRNSPATCHERQHRLLWRRGAVRIRKDRASTPAPDTGTRHPIHRGPGR